MGFLDYRTALVTGASSGIGAATVRRLRAEGLEVHALARDHQRLARLSAETGCRVCTVDVKDLAALTPFAASAEFDILINSAGQSRRGNILDTAPGDVDTLVDVNLRAVLYLTRLIVPGMARRNRGHVVNISSIAGHYAFGENATTFNSSEAYHATRRAFIRCRSSCASISTGPAFASAKSRPGAWRRASSGTRAPPTIPMPASSARSRRSSPKTSRKPLRSR
jgi:NADP-dependent 3-hydroxy acid dehydrogenase YdfG